MVENLLTSKGFTSKSGFIIGIMCEDATSTLKDIEVEVENNQVAVYGIDYNGGRVVVNSVDEFINYFVKYGPVSSLYVYEFVPLPLGAPHLPLYVEAHANKFTTEAVTRMWSMLRRGCANAGMQAVIHVSDGDERCRSAGLALMLKPKDGTRGSRDVYVMHVLIHFRLPTATCPSPMATATAASSPAADSTVRSPHIQSVAGGGGGLWDSRVTTVPGNDKRSSWWCNSCQHD